MDNLRLTLSCIQDERAAIVYRILQDHNSIHLKLLNELKNSLQVSINVQENGDHLNFSIYKLNFIEIFIYFSSN